MRSVGHGFAEVGVFVGTVLLDVTDVLVGALDVGELVLADVLVEAAGVELGSATDDDVQPARSNAADAVSAAIVALRTFVRVATPPSRDEEPRQLGTESSGSCTLG